MTTFERLAQLLQREFDIPAASLVANATLESLDIDSLRLIEIVFAIEDEFGVAMPQDQGEIRGRVNTLGDLAALIDELPSRKGSG